VSESVEHGNFVTELVDEFLSDVWVEDLFDRDWSALEVAVVDNAEAAYKLENFFYNIPWDIFSPISTSLYSTSMYLVRASSMLKPPF
jgi:hypothetical protein